MEQRHGHSRSVDDRDNGPGPDSETDSPLDPLPIATPLDPCPIDESTPLGRRPSRASIERLRAFAAAGKLKIASATSSGHYAGQWINGGRRLNAPIELGDSRVEYIDGFPAESLTMLAGREADLAAIAEHSHSGHDSD